jgi:hypothetical protein
MNAVANILIVAAVATVVIDGASYLTVMLCFAAAGIFYAEGKR